MKTASFIVVCIAAPSFALPADTDFAYVSRRALQCYKQGNENTCTCRANFLPTWYGINPYNVNDFSTNCANQNNAQCLPSGKACDLYSTVTNKADMTSRIAHGNAKIVSMPGQYNDHSVLSLNDPKWLVIPGSYKQPTPVIGIEDPKKKEGSWNAAWDVRPDLAKTLAQLVPAWKNTDSTLRTLCVGINPGTKRSRHQMHMHVAKCSLPLRGALKDKKKFSKLTQIPGTADPLWAIYVDSQHIKMGFASATKHMETVVAGMVPKPDSKIGSHHSVIIVPGEDGTGYYLVVGWDVHVENYLCKTMSELKGTECDYHWKG